MKKHIHIPRFIWEAVILIAILVIVFGLLGTRMGAGNMMNTITHTAHDLLLNTVFFLMGITVLSGAFGKLLVEFGVVRIIEKILRPLMKPLFGLPGVAALGAVLTFLSDNPAIISLAKDKQFASYFKKYQLISLTNFGTAFGMGLVVIAFMIGQGFSTGAFVGIAGAVVGGLISTRLMQFFVLKSHPEYKLAPAIEEGYKTNESALLKDSESKDSVFIRALNAILDGGKVGVELGLAIIPGVLIISTAVMMMTFGPAGEEGQYMGAAYEGVPLLPYLADKIDWFFKALFGFESPELVAFPITALGAVGAALGLVPRFIEVGIIDNNAIAVFTAMGMCWSGYLSTHTAMLDSLGYRKLTGKAIAAHTIGGLCAGVFAHWLYVLVSIL